MSCAHEYLLPFTRSSVLGHWSIHAEKSTDDSDSLATESLTCNESLSALSPHWQTGSSFYFFYVISWWGTITGIYLWSHLLWSLTCCLIISYGLRFQRHICLCLLFSSKKSHDLVSKLSHLVFLLVSSSQVEYFFLVSRKNPWSFASWIFPHSDNFCPFKLENT